MVIKALFLDLDGTALNSNHEIAPELPHALTKIRQQNIEIIVSTGRNFSSSILLAKQLGAQQYIINYNGGRVFDFKSQTVLMERSLSPSLVKRMIDFAEEHDLHLNLYHDDQLYVSAPTPEADFYQKTTGLAYHVVDFKTFIGKDSIKALFVSAPENTEKLTHLVKTQFPDITVVCSTSQLIEILPKGMSKAVGAAHLLEHLQIDPKHAMAFGDQANDYELLEFVGHGFLMGNAPEQLKSRIPLERHTLSNDDYGIIHMLTKMQLI